MVIVAAERRLLGIGRSRADQEFEKMYRRFAEEVFRYVLLVLRSRPDAEDVTQATFVRAYRALQNGERVRKPHNWLIKIAHNECRRHLASASRRGIEVELDPALVPAPESGDAPSVEELREAMSHLSFNQRAALVMRELEDRSYAEIADVLDLTVSAVETLLFRARRALREQLEGALACDEVEELLSRQLDGALPADDRRRLRAHTRACADCATLERRQRGRRAALRRLGSSITLPSSLSSFVGGGGGTVAGGMAIGLGAKAAAVAMVALAVTSVGSSEASRPAAPVRSAAPVAATASATARAKPAHRAPRTHASARTARVVVHAAPAKATPDRGRARPTPQNHAVEPEAPAPASPAPAAPPRPAASASAAPAAAQPAPPAERPTLTETVENVAQTLPAVIPPVQAPTVALPALPAPTLPALPPAPSVTVPPVTLPPPALPAPSLPLPLPPALPSPPPPLLP